MTANLTDAQVSPERLEDLVCLILNSMHDSDDDADIVAALRELKSMRVKSPPHCPTCGCAQIDAAILLAESDAEHNRDRNRMQMALQYEQQLACLRELKSLREQCERQMTCRWLRVINKADASYREFDRIMFDVVFYDDRSQNSARGSQS